MQLQRLGIAKRLHPQPMFDSAGNDCACRLCSWLGPAQRAGIHAQVMHSAQLYDARVYGCLERYRIKGVPR